MILCNLNVSCEWRRERSREFNFGCHATAHLFLTCLGRFQTDGVGKVVVELTPGPPDADRLILTSLVLSRAFDFDAYWAAGHIERQATLNQVIFEELTRAAKSRGWDADAIERAYRCVAERGYRNVQRWRRPLSNPGRTLKAQVVFEFGVESIEGFVAFTDQGGRETIEHLFTIPPSDFHLAYTLGRLRWVTADTVVLTERGRSGEWRATYRG
jgi:hypothetical protein